MKLRRKTHPTQTNEEILIRFLLNKLEDSTDNTVAINQSDIPEIGLSEKQIIKSVYFLQTDGLIKIKMMSSDNDLSISCYVSLTSDCCHYFENKENDTHESTKQWIWWSITTAIAIGSLVIQFLAA